MAGDRSPKGPQKGTDGGLHEMPSGLIHTADSLAYGPGGMFVDRFGPPGDPTKKTAPGDTGDATGIGRAPTLLTAFQHSNQRTNTKGGR